MRSLVGCLKSPKLSLNPDQHGHFSRIMIDYIEVMWRGCSYDFKKNGQNKTTEQS